MAAISPGIVPWMPQPATATPPAAALDSDKGISPRFALEDHTHAAKVQRAVVVTGAGGLVKWTYARPIVCASGQVPPIANMVEDTGNPVIVTIDSREFTSAGGQDTHTSVTIKAVRSQPLPATIGTVLALVNFNVFAATAVAGIKVNLFAAPPTQ